MMNLLNLIAGELTLDIAPEIGGSIARFRHGDQDLLRPAPPGADDAGAMASFPLVPFSNRVRGGQFECDGRTVTLSPNLPGDPSPLHGQGWRNAGSTRPDATSPLCPATGLVLRAGVRASHFHPVARIW